MPIVRPRGSRLVTRLKPTFKKIQPLAHWWTILKSAWIFNSIGKIGIDNKSRFGYQDGYSGRLIGVPICWVKSETGTYFTIFDSSALKKQLLIFYHFLFLSSLSNVAFFQYVKKLHKGFSYRLTSTHCMSDFTFGSMSRPVLWMIWRRTVSDFQTVEQPDSWQEHAPLTDVPSLALRRIDWAPSPFVFVNR